jgi:exopolyphosphatase/pppGpp-phosphohydrolase
MKFAAIDIGSNAVRLLLARVFENPDGPFIKKESLVRMPIRLGDDAFLRKTIPQEKIKQLSNTMLAFKHLMEAYQPIDYLACATSAMREADNSQIIITEIARFSGLKLEVIDGKKENSPITYKKLISISKSVRQYSFEERIYKLGLRPDRSDVILPAAKIFSSVMRWGNIKQIYVPQIGLADGLVNILYQRYKS